MDGSTSKKHNFMYGVLLEFVETHLEHRSNFVSMSCPVSISCERGVAVWLVCFDSESNKKLGNVSYRLGNLVSS